VTQRGILLTVLGFLGLDADTWTAIGTWTIILPSAFAIWHGARQNRLIHSSETVRALHKEWSDAYFRRRRRALARSLKNGQGIEKDGEEVLVFFETMGSLVHRGVLDKKLVWNEFAWDITHYWMACRHPRNEIQGWRDECADPTLWSEFEWLYHEVIRIDARKRRIPQARAEPSVVAVNEFLDSEATLEDEFE
jgi:hypothetical protein